MCPDEAARRPESAWLRGFHAPFLVENSPVATDPLKAEAQAALDELTREGLLPYELEAREVIPDGNSWYTVRYFDGRLRAVVVICEDRQSFKEAVRAAVLQRVLRLDRPPADGEML